jgi:hypothetical protein
LPIGFSPSRRPARASLMAEASASIARSWPNTIDLRSRSRLRSVSRSSVETALGGMRAILATMSSTSFTVTVFRRLFSGSSMREAPTSSITSIALSGSLRSWM